MKMCNDLNGIPVERVLKFMSTRQLLSYSIATNVPGCPREFFACCEGDTESDVKDLVDKFVSQLLAISDKSFEHLQNEYSDVICEINQAITVETAYNDTSGIKKIEFGDKGFEKKNY